jgi:hypothetical protein
VAQDPGRLSDRQLRAGIISWPIASSGFLLEAGLRAFIEDAVSSPRAFTDAPDTPSVEESLHRFIEVETRSILPAFGSSGLHQPLCAALIALGRRIRRLQDR